MLSKLKKKLISIEDKLVEHKYPPQLVVENTSYCNQKCIHCSHKDLIRPNRHMKRAIWDKIVEEIGSEFPTTEIWPTFYGEALILGKNNELWNRLNYAQKVGCENLVLNSNGMLLDRWNNIEKVLNSPLKRFILSLDGFSSEVFDKVRVGGDRDKIYASVEELVNRKEKRGQIYPMITAQFSMLDENQHEVEKYKEYWNDRGVEVKVRPKLEWGAVGNIHSDKIDHSGLFRIACPWGNNTMAIHQNGDVVACAIDYEGYHKLGNVENLSIQELWHRLGESLRKPHREHRWKDIPDICKGCNDWQTAGADYEEETVPGTRPFWFNNN